jgi:hypothetical protein
MKAEWKKTAASLWAAGIPMHLTGMGITRKVPGPKLTPYRVTLATGRFRGKTAARDGYALRHQVCMLDARPVAFFCGGAR